MAQGITKDKNWLPATTLVESLVALVLISASFSISMLIFNNLVQHQPPVEQFRALQGVRSWENPAELPFSGNSNLKIERIQQQVQGQSALFEVRQQVKNQKGTVVFEQKTLEYHVEEEN